MLCGGLQSIVEAAPAAAATTIHVPADQPTISAALAVAVDGDTIEVAPGTFNEAPDFEGKDVDLVASGGPSVTTIRPVGLSGIRLGPGGSIEGFTIRDTNTQNSAAVWVSGTGSVVRGNRFQNNAASYGASAIAGTVATPVIDRNLFTANTCDGQSNSGVVAFSGTSYASVTNNIFLDNPCRYAINMHIGPSGQPTIVNNTIVGGGTGVIVDGGSVGEPTIVRNNIITEQSEYGFLLSVSYGQTPTIENNAFFANSDDFGGASVSPDDGNVFADPLFLDRLGGDLRLQPTSPAVDSGTSAGAPSDDFDGSARPLDGPDADVVDEFDMGAFERDGSEPPPVPPTGILDRGWSVDGLQNQSSRYAIALGPTSDGGTYTGVYKATDGNGPMRISKYTPTGAPGAGWGSTGYVIRAFEPGGKGTSVPTNVVPSGTKVTVVGEHYRGTARLGVARLLSDGSYDTTFSSDGRRLYKIFPTEHDVVTAFRADVLTGGKIGIAVAAFDYDSRGSLVFTAQAMLKLNSNGTADTTFSRDGFAVIPQNWSDIRWRPNGSSFVGVQGSSTHQVRKLLPSGQLDVTFSDDGIASAGCGTHRGATMEVDSSNRPLLMCVKSSGTSTTLAMYRFSTAGAFDTTYSGDGKTLWVIPNSNGPADDVMYGFDSRAKAWAIAGGPGATTTMRLYTLNASGNPDTAFSGDGASSISLPFNVNGNTFGRVASNRLFIANYNGAVNVSMIAIKV